MPGKYIYSRKEFDYEADPDIEEKIRHQVIREVDRSGAWEGGPNAGVWAANYEEELRQRYYGEAAEKQPEKIGEYDLVSHLYRQREFSLRAFGPHQRINGVIDHIKKELKEIEKDPQDLEEWIDVILLASDGAQRAGYEPEEIAAALVKKLTKNENRDWPDWRTADPDKAIEHIRD